MLNLKPHEFYKLTPGEFIKLIEGYETRKTHELWIYAYFVASILAVDVKGITPEKLMKPFLKEKSADEIKREREAFFKDFYKQREEAR